ncbi:hypothetical protein BROUX41_001327 [Berkeleyomyces rouxiae]
MKPSIPASSLPAVAIPRAQMSLERLSRQRMSTEPRGIMNCKSCRKRKIKCNRLTPACEACQIFQYECVYDAVPKKRGPKTEVVDETTKRTKRTKLVKAIENEKSAKHASPNGFVETLAAERDGTSDPEISLHRTTVPCTREFRPSKRRATMAIKVNSEKEMAAALSPTNLSCQSHAFSYTSRGLSTSPASEDEYTSVQAQSLLDTYFQRFHGKPYKIVDETLIRQKAQTGKIPAYLLNAICAVAWRHTHHSDGPQASAHLSNHYAFKARSQIDIDEPSIERLQTLLLLVMAFTASGKGKKAYSMMTSAVAMAIALGLHCEPSPQAHIKANDCEFRRHIFWTCYIMDRFMACGSKRPLFIAERTAAALQLPSRIRSDEPTLPMQSSIFQNSPLLQQQIPEVGKKVHCSYSLLVGVSKILGYTNQYIAMGNNARAGVCYPWDPDSEVSKICIRLETWEAGSRSVFASMEAVLAHPEASILVLSRLVYHAVYCLIFRPFLPMELAELHEPRQNQAWQMNATETCFFHANSIMELTSIAQRNESIQFPPFLGLALCIAATVHMHGVHYVKGNNMASQSLFYSSSDFLSREMACLAKLETSWAIVKHHCDTLEALYKKHSELVSRRTKNASRYVSPLQGRDFFDRYATTPNDEGFYFDAANLSVSETAAKTADRSETGSTTALRKEISTSPRQGKLKRKFSVSSDEYTLGTSYNAAVLTQTALLSVSNSAIVAYAQSPRYATTPLLNMAPSPEISQSQGPSRNFTAATTKQTCVPGFSVNNYYHLSSINPPSQNQFQDGNQYQAQYQYPYPYCPLPTVEQTTKYTPQPNFISLNQDFLLSPSLTSDFYGHNTSLSSRSCPVNNADVASIVGHDQNLGLCSPTENEYLRFLGGVV